jgi:hypothetical protein
MKSFPLRHGLLQNIRILDPGISAIILVSFVL